jgi:hypothetical protein
MLSYLDEAMFAPLYNDLQTALGANRFNQMLELAKAAAVETVVDNRRRLLS